MSLKEYIQSINAMLEEAKNQVSNETIKNKTTA